MKRVLKLINGETLMGEVEVVKNSNPAIGDEILIKKPFCAIPNVGMMPYMSDTLTNAPAAVQIHPMNVLWSVEMSEFPDALDNYNDACSEVLKPESTIII
jgi:hypothetical protein